MLANAISATPQKLALDGDASLPETLEWLKANLPFTYTQPRNSERQELTREAVSYVHIKGCTMSYEISSEPLQRAPAGENVSNELDRNEWRIELGRLNSGHVKFQSATQPDRRPRIVFSSFDPSDPEVASKLSRTEPTVFVNYTNKAIWHRTRMGNSTVREEFVIWGAIPVKDETIGGQIAKALSHAIELCHQLAPRKSGP